MVSREPQHNVLLSSHAVMVSSGADTAFNWCHAYHHKQGLTKQMTRISACAAASVCDDFVTLGRKNGLQGTWERRRRRREKQLEPQVHLLPFPPVTLEVLSLCFFSNKEQLYFYRRTASDLGSALALDCGGNRWGGLIMSRESDGMRWSSFGHLSHGTSWCFVWRLWNTLFSWAAVKLSINNCWHFLCLDWVTAMMLWNT